MREQEAVGQQVRQVSRSLGLLELKAEALGQVADNFPGVSLSPGVGACSEA